MQPSFPAPPAVARRKNHAGLIIVLIVAGLLLAGAITSAVEKQQGLAHEPNPVVNEPPSLDPAMIVDMTEDIKPGSVALLCLAIDTIGYRAAFRAFESGYGSNQDPSAEAVFAEVASRC